MKFLEEVFQKATKFIRRKIQKEYHKNLKMTKFSIELRQQIVKHLTQKQLKTQKHKFIWNRSKEWLHKKIMKYIELSCTEFCKKKDFIQISSDQESQQNKVEKQTISSSVQKTSHRKITFKQNFKLASSKRKNSRKKNRSKNFYYQESKKAYEEFDFDNYSSQEIESEQFTSKKRINSKIIQQKSSQTSISNLEAFQKVGIYGHFLYGDKIKKIKELIKLQDSDDFMALIQWRPRKSKQTPSDTLILTQSIKEHQPKQLIKFYQQHHHAKFLQSMR